jgi:lipopolysaccharide biosynthesis protein
MLSQQPFFMPRLIAFHLPQFHPIPENDEWWGKGFTEWTNVTKAEALVRGQYQPHLPTDLGFYDLRLPETRIAQAEMAKDYGIHGFCYYHYWFDGKKLLERPVEEMLKSGEPDFPFMLCWANETWSRRWDGSDQIILIKQHFSPGDAYRHFHALLPYFQDPRYIRIDGKPFFLIYRSTTIPNLEEYLGVFRSEARKAGIELYLGRVESHAQAGVEYASGFDVAVEFQPGGPLFAQYRAQQRWQTNFRYTLLKKIAGWRSKLFNSINQFETYWHLDHGGYLDYLLSNYEYPSAYKRYPCVMPSWDNTARRPKTSFFFTNSQPAHFEKWLEYHFDHFKPFSKEEDFIFVNAWNEWAEGCHLEPCRKWGRSFLDIVKKITQHNRHA